MSFRERIAPVAARVEAGFARFQRVREAGVIEPYLGYASGDDLVLRGRVLARDTRKAARARQSRLQNALAMLRLFLTKEVAGVEVAAPGVSTRTDDEGYFALRLPRPAEPGWAEVDVRCAGVAGRLVGLVPDPAARFGVISDIDDTMMRTGAWTLWRNLWTTFTGSVESREVFPDAIRLMERLSEGGLNPVFFVSSSPWNLHAFITDVFARAGLVRGPLFLRDLGISQSQFITGTHGDHKGGAIDKILSANPGLPFVLIGDSGQHDAQVYLDAILHHPGRIERVILRVAGPVSKEDRDAVEHIRATGTPVEMVETYDALVD